MRPFGAGYVTVLAYDPDTARSRDWRRISQFYGKLIANQGAGGAAVHALRDALSAAVMVRNLKPPNLQLIVIFLLIYLVILVPVNYFVLKKMDKRELAWVTTPVIVLVFTVGAYGIGYVTKGNRLVTNVVSVVETASGQQSGMAVSQLLIFSPSRTAYRLNLGGAALVARESGRDEYDDFGRPSRTGALTLLDTPAGLQVERLQVNMWAFRQMTMAHQIELGHGVTGALNDTGSSTPHVTGTVTNGTPFNFALCELYAGGRWVASFSLKPGQRLAVSPGGATPTVKLDEQEQFMLDSLRDKAKTGLFTTPHLREGFVLVGYTADPKARVPLTINDRAATGAMTMVVAHL